jgi:tRNA threonylcarbamoyladenosine biosynthesis protein TsaE
MLIPGTPFISHSPEETVAKGRELAQVLTPPVLVLLSGDLGSGKTTFTKGIISALGVAEENDVTSPTFTLVHVFQKRLNAGESASPPASAPSNQFLKVYHVDLYRIDGLDDLMTLALEDALSESAVVIIEWSERCSLRSDWPRIEVTLEHVDPDSRRITISGAAQPEKRDATLPPHALA